MQPTPSSSSDATARSPRDKPWGPPSVTQSQRSIDVVVTWAGTPLCVERLARAETFTLGAAPPSADNARHFLFDHPSLPSSAYPLVEHRHDGAVVVRATEGMSLALDGVPVAMSEVSLAKGARARVTIGPLRVDVAGDKRAATVVSTMRDLVDGRLLRLSGVALALHAGFVVALLFTRSPDPVELFAGKNAPRWVSTSTTPPAAKKPIAKIDAREPEQAASSQAKIKKPTPTTKKGTPSARDLAMTAISQMFASTDATSKVFGDAGINAGLGDLHGAHVAGPDNGMGVRRGPGGIGEGAKGVGGINGRIGGGGDPGGSDVVLLPGRKPSIIVDTFSPPVQSGDGLTREEIQRVLKRVMSQIKFCYEKELNREPTLEGKLTSAWTITKDGSVSGAQLSATTMQKTGGDQVGSCVTRILGRLQFPAPRGGGQVVVTYPFVFSTAGAR